jgi:serine acetyltransferase/GT2 family glycosyltransferase
VTSTSPATQPEERSPRVSVVIPTFDRMHHLVRLLEQLSRQSSPLSDFEVIVVDDGSHDPVAAHLERLEQPYSLWVLRQANAGAAAARHRGSLAARGEILIFVDDDMQVPVDFVLEHTKRHHPGEKTVVLGRIRPDPGIGSMPVFERWHAHMLDRLAEDLSAGRARPRGCLLYTGNVSMRREDYLAVGGFDPCLAQSEDSELGLRLEQAGASFQFSNAAYTLHGSDRTSAEAWLRRALRLGVCDERVARKHPGIPDANPWRFLFELHPLTRPWIAAAVAAPDLAEVVPRAALAMANGIDRLGWPRAALAATTFAYGVQYFRGIRQEAGHLGTAIREAAAFMARHRTVPGRRAAAAIRTLVDDVRADHDALTRNQAKYGSPHRVPRKLRQDLVQNVGFQMMAAYRLMRAFRSAGMLLPAKLTSRAIRHLYGSDLHWDAVFEPGVMLVHGMGLAVSGAARVGRGSILFQHVTLGAGIHPDTRQAGAPVIGQGVHVGPGASIIGPVVIGAGSKVMGSTVVMHSVPPHSLVRSAPAESQPRGQAKEPPPRVKESVERELVH